MTQGQSSAWRRAFAALTSFSLLASGTPGFAQSIGEPSTAPLLGSIGAGASASSLGRLDTPFATPYIRQDEKGLVSGNAQTITTPASFKALVPNDFQKFVQESTGQVLPLFGADFFAQANGAFAPQTNTPVSADYRLGPGDEVQIRGWGSIDIDVRTVVDRNGLIHIPHVGSVALAGVQSLQAEPTIRAAISRYYKDFQLSVTQGQLRGITVYVVGQARQPGAFNLSGASTLVSALFASGGPNKLGSMRHVQVKRGGSTVTELDLYDFLAKGDKSADVKLQDGDTIVIPPAKGYVALTGKVSTPAVYELANEQETIAGVLSIAGGLPVVADPKRAYLEHVDPTQKPSRSVESFALDPQGLSRKLRNGDLLTVLPLTAEFANAVMLRGNIEQAARMPWRPGMKVRDLIPTKAVLMSRSSVLRQNNVLLQDTDNESTLAGRIGNLVDEVNLEYAVVERINSADVSVQLLPFNLGAALADANSPENLPLQAGDIVTVFSVNDVRVPQSKRQVFVRVEGEVKHPGIYQMSPSDSLPQLLEKAGGLTPDAYLFGTAFYREEVRRAQSANLEQLTRRLESQLQTQLSSAAASVSTSPESAGAGQLRVQSEVAAQKQAVDRLRNLKPSGRIMLGMQADSASPDKLPALKLVSQDRMVIPSRPDFVYVLGSVNTESSLIWSEGKSVQHYLDLSGLTSGADKAELFIIRADGSVLSDNGNWFSHITSATVQPGDVIVLPEKTDHESAWSVFTRNAKDITQIVYQFSLGAAAIKTLRN